MQPLIDPATLFLEALVRALPPSKLWNNASSVCVCQSNQARCGSSACSSAAPAVATASRHARSRARAGCTSAREQVGSWSADAHIAERLHLGSLPLLRSSAPQCVGVSRPAVGLPAAVHISPPVRSSYSSSAYTQPLSLTHSHPRALALPSADLHHSRSESYSVAPSASPSPPLPQFFWNSAPHCVPVPPLSLSPLRSLQPHTPPTPCAPPQPATAQRDTLFLLTPTQVAMVTVLQNVKVLFVALCAERRRRHPHMTPFGLVLHGAAGIAGPDCRWVRKARGFSEGGWR